MKFPLYCGFAGRLSHATRASFRPRIIGVLAVLAAGVLMQACSAIKVAYNQAPELGYWQLDSYFDLNSTQGAQVKNELARLQGWHRETQLPAYIAALQKLETQLPGNIDARQACSIVADVRTKLVTMTSHAEPAMAGLVVQLGSQQLANLERKFAKGDEEFKDDFIDASAKSARNKRYKQAVKRAEMLYGRLEERQLAVINERIDRSSFDAKLSLAERQRRQQDALQTLRPLVGGQASATAALPAVHGWLERAYNSPTPAHRAYMEELTQDGCKTFAEVHNSTTPEQRRKAVEVVQGYAQDFRLLGGQRG